MTTKAQRDGGDILGYIVDYVAERDPSHTFSGRRAQERLIEERKDCADLLEAHKKLTAACRQLIEFVDGLEKKVNG